MTTTITPIPVRNGVTHTGDNVNYLQAAMLACVELILEDPEWTADVIVAALLAQHEMKRGMPRHALSTLDEALRS